MSTAAEYRSPEPGVRSDPRLRAHSTGHAGRDRLAADGLASRIRLALHDLGLGHAVTTYGVRTEGDVLIIELYPGHRADDFVVALEELAHDVPATAAAVHTPDPAQLTLFQGDAR